MSKQSPIKVRDHLLQKLACTHHIKLHQNMVASNTHACQSTAFQKFKCWDEAVSVGKTKVYGRVYLDGWCQCDDATTLIHVLNHGSKMHIRVGYIFFLLTGSFPAGISFPL